MVQLRLYNTLSKTKEELKTAKDKKIGLYSCGPTVYYFAHIGNMRNYLEVDILKRMLIHESYKVEHIMNITDVGHLVGDGDVGEDKIALTAQKENKSTLEVAEFYTRIFFDDIKKLNILIPNKTPKATDHISDMLSLISILEKKGYIYKVPAGVYFDTSKFKDYGALIGMSFDKLNKNLKAGARVKRNQDIKNITDFALWRLPQHQQKGTLWESPYGTGFPGWHIECSAMSMKYLGKTIDIHTGGVDHIPIHHTNEIAQSEAATKKKFVNEWFHIEFLTVDGKKMSKSLNNIYTLDDILAKNYSPEAVRYFLISGHYRQQLNFTLEALSNASKTLQSIYNFMETLSEARAAKSSDKEFLANLKNLREKFFDGMRDDLNMPGALATMHNLIGASNQKISRGGLSEEETLSITGYMLEFDKILGLGFKSHLSKKGTIIPKEAKELIKAREKARFSRDFKAADDIRKALFEKYGITIEDTKDGPLVHRN